MSAAKSSTGKQSTGKQSTGRQQRARYRRSRRARRGGSNWTLWIVLGVIVVVGVALIVASTSTGGNSSSASTRSPAPKALVDKVTSVPQTVADEVGLGTAKLPTVIGAPTATSDGKPVITYVGAEYCPYCAGERWAMVLALSRFGTFSNLSTTHSASEDVLPDTQTFSFHGSTYTSPYLQFDPVELQTNQLAGNSYQTLDKPTDAQNALMAKYDVAPYFKSNGAIPFVYFAGKYALSGASYDVSALQGKSATEIAAAMHDPTSAIAKGIVGTANAITASICAATGDQPASACATPAVKAIRSQLG